MRSRLWLLTPAGLLYGLLGLVPLAVVVRFALSGRGFGTVLGSRLLVRVVSNTVWISLITTGIALVLGTVLAAALWRTGGAVRTVLMGFVLLPFWTAVLIKNFAWAALLQDNGAVNAVLRGLGLVSGPVTLLHNRLAVVIGMVHFVLPYAALPIFNAMVAIDERLILAATGLGASAGPVLRRVVLPLVAPGLLGAALLVFVISAGFYITPVVLGSPADMMVANLVDYYVHELVDFNAAAALALLILAAILPLVLVQQAIRTGNEAGARHARG